MDASGDGRSRLPGGFVDSIHGSGHESVVGVSQEEAARLSPQHVFGQSPVPELLISRRSVGRRRSNPLPVFQEVKILLSTTSVRKTLSLKSIHRYEWTPHVNRCLLNYPTSYQVHPPSSMGGSQAVVK